MCCILFGWKKASKCKKEVALLRSRLKLLRRKRYSIVMQLREDIALLLRNGQIDCALARVEQLYKDQSLLDAYDQLEQCCESVLLRFSYIRRHKDRPDDINEAISTLIFATAWCGDLPELPVIKKLFGDRYGHKYVNAAAKLYSGSLINLEMTEKLCVKFVPEDAKLELIDEIAKDYSIQPWNQGSANRTEPPSLQLQVCGNTDHQVDRFVIEEEDTKSYHVTGGAALSTEHSPQAKSKLTIMPFNMVRMQETAFHLESNCQDKYMCQPKMMPCASPCETAFPERTGSNKLSAASFYEKEDIKIAETSDQEVLSQSHKISVYLEEVEEVQYSDVQDQYGDEKTIFLFNLRIPSLIDNSEFHGGAGNVTPNHLGITECRSLGEGEEISSACEASGASSTGFCSQKSCPCTVAEKEINVQTARTIIVQKSLEAINPEKHLQSDPWKSQNSKVSRAASCSHVHPKLPDYDELVATFRALKKEHLQRNYYGQLIMN